MCQVDGGVCGCAPETSFVRDKSNQCRCSQLSWLVTCCSMSAFAAAAARGAGDISRRQS